MLHRTRTTARIAVVASAVGLLGAVAGPASAGEDSGMAWAVSSNGYTHGSGAWWTSYGDVINVDDQAVDGHSGVGMVHLSSSADMTTVWDTDGANSSWASKTWNLTEGTKVTIHGCMGESGTGDIFGCGSPTYGSA